MPVEFEYKYILRNDPELRQMFEWNEVPPPFEIGYKDEIEQFYISENARFRHIKGDRDYEYVFTYKHMIDGKLLEIETVVSAEDYELAKAARIAGLRKDRHIFYENFETHSHKWEVDFLLNEDGTAYFALMEIEMAVGLTSPEPPDFLKPYIELVVPYEDSHLFTNRVLSDPFLASRAVETYRRMVAGDRRRLRERQ